MSSYYLAGFLAASANISAFLIPFFRSPNSNHLFVQDLDQTQRIRNFGRVQLDLFSVVDQPTTHLELSVGDPGIISARLYDGRILFGTFDVMKSLLMKEDLNTEPTSFFKMDAYRFIGNLNGLLEVASSIRDQISNNSIGDAWLDGERSHLKGLSNLSVANEIFGANILEAEDTLARIINFLTEHPADLNWHRIWREAWTSHRPDERLIKVASWWVEKREFPAPDSGRIFITLANYFHSHSDLEVAALSWILASRGYSNDWAKTWYRLAPMFAELAGFAQAALLFLRAGTDSNETPTVSANQWTRVWTRLRSMGAQQGELLELATLAIPRFGGKSRFLNKVILPLSPEYETESLVQSDLLNRLLYEQTDNNIWPLAFSILSRRGQLSDFMVSEGLRWVLDGNPNLRSWKLVWDELHKYEDREKLNDIALNWLQRANPDMNIWGEILLELSARGVDLEIVRPVAESRSSRLLLKQPQLAEWIGRAAHDVLNTPPTTPPTS